MAHGIAALPRWRAAGRMHSEHAFAREREERLADDLGPADDEDQLRIELVDHLERLDRIDVSRLDERRAEASGDLVERTLPRAVRVDRPRKGDDPDDFDSHLRGRLETVAADRVETHPDRSHRRAMLPAVRSRRRLAAGAVPAALHTNPGVPAEPTEQGDGARRNCDHHDDARTRDIEQLDPREPENAREHEAERRLGDPDAESAADQDAGYRPQQKPAEQREVDVPW